MVFGHNVPEYTVQTLSQAVKKSLESQFGYVRVRGEVSGLKIHTSGHVYLTLKDQDAAIQAVCWRGQYKALGLALEEGMDLVVTARLTSYPGKSQYQLVLERAELAGEGAILKELERLKARLKAEGLFDAHHKKPLPFWPRTIGVITSPTGAVIQDILHRIQDRCPTPVVLWPVAVQGDGASVQIVQALRGLARLASPPDVIIVARGGGSIEDLMPFQTEEVVRAVFECPIPVVSAVGHETDVTLIDFVSDLRAPTPTGAAELVTPVRLDLWQTLDGHTTRLRRGISHIMTHHTHAIALMSARLSKGTHLVDQWVQYLDDMAERLPQALKQTVHRYALRLTQLTGRVVSPLTQVHYRKEQMIHAVFRLNQAWQHIFIQKQQKLQYQTALLDAHSYTKTLARGFVLVKNESGLPLTSAEHAADAATVSLVFHDGVVTAVPQSVIAKKP